MQISLRLTGDFTLTLMETKLRREAGYADLQDRPYPFHTHKIVLLWRNSSKLEGISLFPERKSGKESSYTDNYNRYLNLWLSFAR